MFSRTLAYLSTDTGKVILHNDFLRKNVDNFNYNPLIVTLRYMDIIYVTGVDDFIQDEIIMLPSNISSLFQGTSTINVKLTNPKQIPLVKHIKIRPISPIFYDIKNHKKVLEEKLSKLIVINRGLQITIKSDDISTEIIVEEIIDEIGNTVGNGLILNRDIEVDFLEIPGYAEYLEKQKMEKEEMEKVLEESRKQKEEEDQYSDVPTTVHTQRCIRGGKITYKRITPQIPKEKNQYDYSSGSDSENDNKLDEDYSNKKTKVYSKMSVRNGKIVYVKK